MNMNQLSYFSTSLKKRLSNTGRACPNCNSKKSSIEDRKYIVTELHRCENCHLLYRSPTDSEEDNKHFYQDKYDQPFTTELPDDAALQQLIDTSFVGIDFSYENYISILSSLGIGAGNRIFDFGCSWGYGSWQFAKAGFQVVSYEISQPRAKYAREKLDLTVLGTLPDSDAVSEELAGTFDCFFSSHVMEHVPQPSQVVKLAKKLLKPGGLFVAFTPNGSGGYRIADPEGWHRLWGKVHPNLIDDVYWKDVLSGSPLLFDTSPVDTKRLNMFSSGETLPEEDTLSGGELLCVASL